MEELKKAQFKPTPPVWNVDWVVDVENVGDGENALKYLSQYIFRIAIAPSRITNLTKTHITFKYQNSKTKIWGTCPLEIFEFIRSYLQHVLPSGFMKVRHYGFMAANCKIALKQIYALIVKGLHELGKWIPKKRKSKPRRPKKLMQCKQCGGLFIWLQFIPPSRARDRFKF